MHIHQQKTPQYHVSYIQIRPEVLQCRNSPVLQACQRDARPNYPMGWYQKPILIINTKSSSTMIVSERYMMDLSNVLVPEACIYNTRPNPPYYISKEY